MNQGPELGSDKLALNGGKWVIKTAKMAAALDPVPVVLQRTPHRLLVPEAAVHPTENGQAVSRPKLALLDGNFLV